MDHCACGNPTRNFRPTCFICKFEARLRVVHEVKRLLGQGLSLLAISKQMGIGEKDVAILSRFTRLPEVAPQIFALTKKSGVR